MHSQSSMKSSSYSGRLTTEGAKGTNGTDKKEHRSYVSSAHLVHFVVGLT